MISTLITTVSPAISSGLIVSSGLAATLIVLVLLVVKELLAASNDDRLNLFGERLDVIILSLLFVFSFTVINEVLDILL
jgi:hypothetical protein